METDRQGETCGLAGRERHVVWQAGGDIWSGRQDETWRQTGRGETCGLAGRMTIRVHAGKI